MKTLREYINLIDMKLNEAPGDVNPNSTSAIVKSTTNSATSGSSGGFLNPNNMLNGPRTPVAEVDKIKKNTFDQDGSLVDFTDTDKYDNFTPPDEEEADDYKSSDQDRTKVSDMSHNTWSTTWYPN